MHLSAFLDFALRTLQSGEDSIPAIWSEFSRMAAAQALTAVWQGAAVALGLALCMRLAPRSPARHRFALWAAGFAATIALQLMPLISGLIPVHLQAVGSSVAPTGAVAASHPWLQLSAAWSFLIAGLCLAASLYRATDLALHSLHLRKLWKTALPVDIDPASLPRSFSRLSHATVQICTTSELERPSVIGFFAPRILIPDWLYLRLTPGELDQIVLHETEHLRRRDDWTNLLQKLCLVLFPLNPGLAWIERRLCREREMACDDGVIGITRAPRAYAACLASLAERGLQRRAGMLSLGAWHARPELVRRVHSILSHNHALRPFAARAVLGAVGCVLLAGATALARCPRLISFEPAHSPASEAHNVSAQQAGLASVNSSAQELTAFNSSRFAAENRAPLKQNYSRRAKLNSESSGASQAVEPVLQKDTVFSSYINPANLHRSAQALAAAPSQHNAASSPFAAATEDAALRPDRTEADRTLRSDSGFIVMSTWESFEVTPPVTCREQSLAKAAGKNDSVRVAAPANALAAQRITPRITVTRMYLKIYSAGDKGSTWLVIQL